MVSKKNDSVSAESLVVFGLARSPFVLTEHISSWRASKASETLSGVMQLRFWYIYLFIWYVRPLFPPGLLIRSL